MDGMEYVKNLLDHAVKLRATDLHICAGTKPVIRVNGELTAVEHADVAKPNDVDGIIKVTLDEAKRAKLVERRVLDFSFSVPGMGRFRANVYSQRGTFAIAIRILPFNIPEFGTLGLPIAVEAFTAKTGGLFLVTGATGSGKSTTLASLLDIINKKYKYHIITIEDPIEYLHSHKKSLVTQREIGEDAISFADALRSALREDPDVIMVGEMRDPETVSIALTAAETGHLVLSTLHTVGSAKAVDRIVDAFPPEQQNQVKSQLATVLEGVVSQQLIPRADEPGVVLASEVMFVTPAIRSLIREGKHYQMRSIIQTGQNLGMQLLEANLAELHLKGVISNDEMMLHAQDQQLLMQFLRR